MADPLIRCLRLSMMARGLNVHQQKRITLLKNPYRCITQDNRQWGQNHSYGYSKFGHEREWISPLRKVQAMVLVTIVLFTCLDWKYYLPKVKRRWRNLKKAVGINVHPHAHPLLLERDKIPEGWLGLSEEEIEDMKEVAAQWYADEDIEPKHVPLYYSRPKPAPETEESQNQESEVKSPASGTVVVNAMPTPSAEPKP